VLARLILMSNNNQTVKTVKVKDSKLKQIHLHHPKLNKL
jgi:hypothetical protein